MWWMERAEHEPGSRRWAWANFQQVQKYVKGTEPDSASGSSTYPISEVPVSFFEGGPRLPGDSSAAGMGQALLLAMRWIPRPPRTGCR